VYYGTDKSFVYHHRILKLGPENRGLGVTDIKLNATVYVSFIQEQSYIIQIFHHVITILTVFCG